MRPDMVVPKPKLTEITLNPAKSGIDIVLVRINCKESSHPGFGKDKTLNVQSGKLLCPFCACQPAIQPDST
jgi:hypothetical protein